jgi:adenylate cyclase class 2
MQIEWEAGFWPIDKDEVRGRLKAAGANMVYPERLMRRIPFHLHADAPAKDGFVRVRDEGDKVTLTVKQVGTKIDEKKELEVEVSDFDEAVDILRALGCIERGYQETRRELWTLDEAEITIDEWPFLEPLVEVEGPSEEVIRAVSEKLGFDWKQAVFDSADYYYSKKYGVERKFLTSGISRLTFDIENPFKKVV